jgi:hypothetical protein
MNRVGHKKRASSLAITQDHSPLDGSSSTSAGRLMVLVPTDSNYGAAIQRIWQLATATNRSIYLLGLSKDMTEELCLRRQFSAMTALLGNSGISIEAKREFGTRWVDAIRKNYQMGDMIVCFAEQRDGLLHKPLRQVLQENLDAPIFILFDLYPHNVSRRNGLTTILLWLGWIGLIAGAFVLQIRIMSLPQVGAQTTLMLLSVFVEFWLLWVWNELFS